MALARLRPFSDREWTRAFVLWLGIALVLHLAAAVFSVGFYHTDEHFQILEFLNYKLGRSSGSELAIEFGQRIRPWFQPAFYCVLTRTMQALGISNPFHWAFVFRLISALLGWTSLVGLAVLSYSWFDDPRLRKLVLILSATLWYLPALHARQSSESLSGATFYIAASVLFLFSENRSRLFYLLIGAAFGAAFLFRYQIAFLILGAFGYFCLREQRRMGRRFTEPAMILVGGLAMVGLGVWIDHWGYGEWTFTPWNYFRYNLIQGHVADVDTQPVYDFFTKTLTETFPPLGFLTLCGFVLGWIFRPLHLLTAITFPLYLVHSIIGHKELRFIFPIAFAGPPLVLLALTARNRAGEIWRTIWWSKGGALTWRVLFFINLIALVPTTLLPCWAPARLFSKLYDIKQSEMPGQSMEVLYKDKNPFEILGIPLGFYRPDDTYSTHISSFDELNARITSSGAPVWFFQVGFELPEEAGPARDHCVRVADSLPRFLVAVVRWEPLHPLTHRVTDWTLYRCQL